VKCKHILAALGCALLALSSVGCGAFKGDTNDLESITLAVTKENGVAVTGAGGIVTMNGLGGTLNLTATGNYTNQKTMDLTSKVTWTVAVDPNNNEDQFGDILIPPCQAPACPVGDPGDYTAGTLEWSPTGLFTAVEPAACTFVNLAVDPATTPAWFMSGDYIVTVSFQGITSQPIYIPIASEAGIYDQYSNPTSSCGPTS